MDSLMDKKFFEDGERVSLLKDPVNMRGIVLHYVDSKKRIVLVQWDNGTSRYYRDGELATMKVPGQR
jgi:hypothetical protein